MTEAFGNDIRTLYAQAEKCATLPELVPALYAVLKRNGESLSAITHTYRLTASDTGYTCAFALQSGTFATLEPNAPVDVTVNGREATLLAIFQRKLNPTFALVTGKIKLTGSKAALMQLAAFL
jgi:putative sterol carrier protein